MSRFLEFPPMQRRLSFALFALGLLHRHRHAQGFGTGAARSTCIRRAAGGRGADRQCRDPERQRQRHAQQRDDAAQAQGRYLPQRCVQTGANFALGITFIDATTFNLKANTQITIDNYIYQDGGKQNAGMFDVAKGTAAFVAAAVAKTGDMKITTPTATLGIRGTTGLVEVPKAPPPTIRRTSRSSYIPTPTARSAGSKSMTARARDSAFSPRAPAASPSGPARAARGSPRCR